MTMEETPVLAQWVQIVIAGAAVLVSLAGLLLAADRRGATRSKEIADAITAAETRLRNDARTESERTRSENREAHATIGANITRLGEQLGTQLQGLTAEVAVLRGRQEERDQRGGHV